MRRFAGLVLLAVLALAGPSAAEESWSGEMVDELMSPYCPGRTLRSCPSPDAGELIVWIEQQEQQGRDRESVYTQLLSEFGEEIRQAPSASGFGFTAYLIPILAFLAGGVIVAFFLRSQGQGASGGGTGDGGEADGPSQTAADPELERLVDEELDRSS